MAATTNNNSRSGSREADVRAWLSWETRSTPNLTGFKYPAGKWVQGQALKRNFNRHHNWGKKHTHTTHFSFSSFSFFTPSLQRHLCPLTISTLVFIYLSFSHTCPLSSSIPVSRGRPASSLHFASLLYLSYLSPFPLRSQSSAPQRFFKLLLHFNGSFLFTLQVKHRN